MIMFVTVFPFKVRPFVKSALFVGHDSFKLLAVSQDPTHLQSPHATQGPRSWFVPCVSREKDALESSVGLVHAASSFSFCAVLLPEKQPSKSISPVPPLAGHTWLNFHLWPFQATIAQPVSH